MNEKEDEPKLQTIEDIMTSESSIREYKYKLTPEFFEKVLECEVNLKEKFDPKIFYDLINYYSKAIEYYESMSDPRFIIYNQALSYLFEQSEAKKFLAGKDLGKEFRKKELIKRFKQCEKIVTEEKVKKFVEKKTNDENVKNSIDKLYNKDMERQKDSFMKKKEEKKLKYNDKYNNREKAKNENITNNNNNNSNENNDNKDNENKKEDDNKIKEEEKNNDEAFKFNGGDGIFDLDNIEEQEEISEIDFNIDDVVEFVNIAKEENKEKEKEKEKQKVKEEEKDGDENNNDNKNEEKTDIKDDSTTKVNKNKITLQKSIKFTNKTRFFEKMKDNFDNYFKEYYEYFINNNYIDSILKDFDENEKEISTKVIESGVNFLNQIKDMECLLDNKDSEESYKKEIFNIITQLKGEQKSAIDKIFSESKEKLKKYNNKYLINNTLLKEKFKLDTTKSLNAFIFK